MLHPAQGLDWISGTGNLEFGSQASGTINLCLLPGIQLAGIRSDLTLAGHQSRKSWVGFASGFLTIILDFDLNFAIYVSST